VLLADTNWIGFRTLYTKEVLRFIKVWNQTLIAPIITTLLFLAVFNLSVGSHASQVEGLSFAHFIIPGLIIMAMVQNAFANTSSSLMIAKIQGVIVDYLMPPLSSGELTVALAMGGVTRGILVGITVGLGIYGFVPFSVYSPVALIVVSVLACLMMSLLGVLAGVWSQTFDHLAAITNYVITPLSFLSGTFYSVKQLPEIWYKIAHYNPFFYMIDVFRYSLTGYSDSSVKVGLMIMAGSSVVLYLITYWIIKSGYRLRS